MEKIFLATNNAGKIERFKKLIEGAGIKTEIYTPKDFGLEEINPEETGNTLAENAKIKAGAYLGKVNMPIISNDTGLYVEGEGLVSAPKRIALGDTDEAGLSKEKIAEKLTQFWKDMATKHGGRVDAAWVENFVLLRPDGEMETSESRREIILTNEEYGTPHIQMPVRALYLSKTTGKPSIQHTPEEERLELQPVTDALIKLIK